MKKHMEGRLASTMVLLRNLLQMLHFDFKLRPEIVSEWDGES